MTRANMHQQQRLVGWVEKGVTLDDSSTGASLLMSAHTLGEALKKTLGLKRGDSAVLCFLPGLAFVHALIACVCQGELTLYDRWSEYKRERERM